ncbi:hypothetical protein M758_UG047600 [Ceratodon purpureus]|nr:hypothetical protein M758_UG047600 [Ceratodon purpureus]
MWLFSELQFLSITAPAWMVSFSSPIHTPKFCWYTASAARAYRNLGFLRTSRKTSSAGADIASSLIAS